MDGDNIKEVYFSLYCDQCKHKDLEDTKDPCNECLSIPGRPNSHKPFYFEEDKEEKKE